MWSRLFAEHTKLRMYTKVRLRNSRSQFQRAVTPTRLWLAGAGWSQSPGIGVRLGQLPPLPPSWPQSRSNPTVLENNHGGFVTEIFAFERTSCLLTTAKILGAELFWLLSLRAVAPERLFSEVDLSFAVVSILKIIIDGFLSFHFHLFENMNHNFLY